MQYKYTLGDGFWNSEFTSTGQYLTRRLLVPAQNTIVEDGVQSWQAGPNAPILFEVTVPQNTPSGRYHVYSIQSLQLDSAHPHVESRATMLGHINCYGPLNIIGAFGYRYCRNAQCDSADDAQTPGTDAHGRNVSPTIAPQDIIDTVNEWSWPQKAGSPILVATTIPSRGTGFMAGVEFQSYYDPNAPLYVPPALQNIQALGSNWAIFTPSWTYLRNNPLIFSTQPGKDPFWSDTITSVSQARTINLNVAVFPQPRFTTNADRFLEDRAARCRLVE